MNYPSAYERDRAGAILSEDGRYRYLLWRDWDPRLPVVTWIMLNPSTADALQDDPTIRRVVSFSSSFGFGSAEVVNMYAFRATNPNDIPADKFIAHGPKNTTFLQEACPPGRTVVCAWGHRGGWRVPSGCLSKDTFCLGFNRDGSPIHPLYVPKSAQLVKFE